ncbi:MAG: hypothetical protein ACYDBJ_04585 [Aggregatilineales bacterium]
MLSNDLAGCIAVAAFKATNNAPFKSWQAVQIANVILVAVPGANRQLVSALAGHLTTVPHLRLPGRNQNLTAPRQSRIVAVITGSAAQGQA